MDTTTNLTLLIFSVILAVSAGVCPSGWIPSGTCSACYKFVSNPAPWDKAQALCKDMGGTLAVIDNEQKASFIAGYMLLHGLHKPSSAWYIGGRRHNNVWQWLNRDGFWSTMTYNRWGAGEPNNGMEECATLYSNAERPFTWHDYRCGTALKYICEADGQPDKVVVGK